MNQPTQNNSSIKILLIDDHIVLLEGMSVLLNNDPRYTVCGMMKTSGEGIQAVQELEPDVVILDLSLQDGSGLDVLKQIQSIRPKLPVIILSMHEEELYAERAIRAGASGYVMKGESLDKVFEAIPVVMQGGLYVSDAIRYKLIGKVDIDSGADSSNPLSVLSDRELEIFQLLGKGKRQSAIGEMLHISARTVETHARRICAKLDLNGMKELSEYAISYASDE